MKERLVGAAVLVALGVWLIPWILDGHEPPVTTVADGDATFALPAAEEPTRTQTRTIALTDAERDAGAADGEVAVAGGTKPAAAGASDDATTTPAAATTTAAVRSDAKSETAPPQTPAAVEPAPAPAAATTGTAPAATQAPVDDGWFVQLGSFSDEENARRLASRVATFGYKADVSAYRSGGRTLNRVRVGPSATRDEASVVASSLAAHGFVAQVVPAD